MQPGPLAQAMLQQVYVGFRWWLNNLWVVQMEPWGGSCAGCSMGYAYLLLPV